MFYVFKYNAKIELLDEKTKLFPENLVFNAK